MEQHAIPQAITAYKFRLVGDMTLKQFLELAFGIVMAWMIYGSSMNFLFKWTLAPFFAFFGFALAFVPIEDRPLDLWLINLFKALTRPTQFLYRAQVKPLNIFEVNPPVSLNLGPKINQPGNLADFLKTLPDSPATAFDQAEQKYLEHITSLFGALGFNPQAAVDEKPVIVPLKSNVKGVRVRKLLTPQLCLLPQATVFQAPAEPKQAAIPALVKPQPVTSPAPTPVKPIPNKPAPTPPPAPTPTKPTPAVETKPPVFASGVVLPHVSDKPNLIYGITLNKEGKILSDVIIEVLDKQSLPVRALKSNKLGQFFIATPLTDGVYQIQAEHDPDKFAIIKLEAKGEIIPPLKIQAI